MSTRIPLAGLAVLGGLSAAGGFLAAADGSANARTPAMVRLAGSASALTRKSGHSTKAQASQKLTLAVWMADHAQAAQRFLTAVSTPSSSRYRHFLSPAAYTRRFSASPRQVRAVRSFLISRGFTDVRTSVNGDYVSATGSVARINAAFSVQMRRYETGGATNRSGTIETNDRALSVPAALRPDILAVTGLDSARPRAATASPRSSISSSTCSHYWAQRTTTFSPAYDGLTEAANAPCGYSAQQIRGAYGLTAADTGAGTRIALIQVGSPSHMLRTLTDYARTNGLPAPRPGQYREDHITQGPHRGRCLDGALEEAALDSEAAYAIAPRAEQLMVDGNDCDAASFADQALFEAALAPITGHRSRPEVDIESISYGLTGNKGEQAEPRSDLLAYHAILLRAAAEGVSVLNASGDDPGLEPPDSDPDQTSVGGTTLGIGAAHQRVFETGWSTHFAERTNTVDPWYDAGLLLGASGGTSVLYREPGYQKGVVPSALAQSRNGHDERVVPDISADADPATGMLLGIIVPRKNGTAGPYETFRQAGTSLATPLVAGMVADAEQGHDLGFLNPLLYSLNGTDAFNDPLPLTAADPMTDRAYYAPGDTDIHGSFHPGYLLGINDAQGKGTKQVTAPGYDTMTGLGSPNGPGFIAALRAPR